MHKNFHSGHGKGTHFSHSSPPRNRFPPHPTVHPSIHAYRTPPKRIAAFPHRPFRRFLLKSHKTILLSIGSRYDKKCHLTISIGMTKKTYRWPVQHSSKFFYIFCILFRYKYFHGAFINENKTVAYFALLPYSVHTINDLRPKPYTSWKCHIDYHRCDTAHAML